MQINLPLDANTKLARGFFYLAIIILVIYQFSYVFTPSTAPFWEPDNYEYYIFSNISVATHSFNVTNPYIVPQYYTAIGFFEQLGLFTLPATLHEIFPFIGLVWDFRIIYLIPIICIYLFSFLITKRIIDNTQINKAYRYVSYTIVLLNSFLMQQTQLIEWRGNTFITAIGLMIAYVIMYAYSEPNLKWKNKLFVGGIIIVLSIMASYMWKGWELALVPIGLIPLFEIYKIVKGKRLYKILAVGIILITIAVGIFPLAIETDIVSFFQYLIHINSLFNIFSNLSCTMNILQLGEVNCLSATTGLYAALVYLLFFAFIIKILLIDSLFSLTKEKYEYFIIGCLALAVFYFIPALVYLRLLQLCAPYLSIGFAVGISCSLARGGVGRIVQVAMTFVVILASIISVLSFWQALNYTYTLNNPVGLVPVTHVLSNYSNSTVFSFYGWGGYLQAYAHVKTYADTIQNLATAEAIDNFLSSYPVNCSYLYSFNDTPDFVVLSPILPEFTLFYDSPNQSVAKSPWNIIPCGYNLFYQNNSFWVFKRITGNWKW